MCGQAWPAVQFCSSGVHLVQPPSSSRVSYSRLPTTISSWVLNFSTDRDPTTSQGNLFQWSGHSLSFWSTSLSAYLISTSSAFLWRCLPDSVKSHFEVKVNNIHYSPLMPHASHLILEGYQVGLAWFLLCKSTLTTLSHFLVFHGFGNDFQGFITFPGT